jgi:hypothetical protein
MTDINYSIILDRLRPPDAIDVTNNWRFAAHEEMRLAQKRGDTEPKLYPEMVHDYFDYDTIIWNDTKPLTQQECADEWQVVLAERTNEEVDEKRRNEYGSWQEQFDMQYWDNKNGTTNWVDHITQVKNDNPKD